VSRNPHFQSENSVRTAFPEMPIHDNQLREPIVVASRYDFALWIACFLECIKACSGHSS
jgi:hypothetical protein